MSIKNEGSWKTDHFPGGGKRASIIIQGRPAGFRKEEKKNGKGGNSDFQTRRLCLPQKERIVSLAGGTKREGGRQETVQKSCTEGEPYDSLVRGRSYERGRKTPTGKEDVSVIAYRKKEGERNQYPRQVQNGPYPPLGIKKGRI